LIVGVGIEDEVAFGDGKPAAQRRSIAAIAFVAHDAQERAQLRLQLRQTLPGAIATPVVDDHDLVGARPRPRRRRRAHGPLDVAGLVVRWHDERDRRASHFVPWQSP
jgi:hypothetical protein